jgi:hypothetical protein
MTLQEMIRKHAYTPKQSVPDWMIGCFRRRSISFANGESDDQTIVYWMQSRNFTIDLRLPLKEDQVPTRDIADCTPAELAVMANYEGWEAASHWENNRLRWSGGTALQLTDRWPEEAELQRIGNCMIEFAPSGSYVEDWRLQPSAPGPLVGLRLVEEHYPQSGESVPRRGGLIICGDHAALVLGRASPLPAGISTKNLSLPDRVADAIGDPEQLRQLLDFETSVASGNPDQGYAVLHSTVAARVNESLLPDGEFESSEDSNRVQYQFTRGDQTCVWIFEIDVLEPLHNFTLSTPSTDASMSWFGRESETLTRYTRVLT